MMTPPYSIFEINIGDWSDDGHGKTEEHRVAVPSEFTQEMIAENYKNNCKKYGITLEQPCGGYGDRNFPIDPLRKMVKDGLNPSIVKNVDKYGEMAEIYTNDFFDIVCHMFFHGMPAGFTWHEIKTQGILLGGYGATQSSGGYGLFY